MTALVVLVLVVTVPANVIVAYRLRWRLTGRPRRNLVARAARFVLLGVWMWSPVTMIWALLYTPYAALRLYHLRHPAMPSAGRGYSWV